MFWRKAKKLEGQAIVDAIKIIQDPASKRTQKNSAFQDLRDTFGGLIYTKFDKVKHLGDNKQEWDEIKHHIESQFFQTLTELTPKSPGEIVSYINHAFNTKINQESIKLLLGKGEVMESLEKLKFKFKNALRDFHKKYKRSPDFADIEHHKKMIENVDNPEDLGEATSDMKKLAEIMKVKVEEVQEYINTLGSLVSSMDQQISGDDGKDDNITTLMDTLHTDEPLPDEVLRDKEIRQAIIEAIKESFSAEEQKVIMAYLFTTQADYKKAIEMFGDENVKKELTNDQVAGITGVPERKVRHYLSKYYREKLQESPVLHDLMMASLVRSMVKMAMSRYKTTEDLIFEIVANRCDQQKS